MEGELDEKDKEYERRLRTMRQELERMRPIYEAKSKDPELAKRVNQLEQEVINTKNYYQKRIRELEEKRGFKIESVVEPKVEQSKVKEVKSALKKPLVVDPEVEQAA